MVSMNNSKTPSTVLNKWDCRNPFRRRGKDNIIPTTMNSPRVTKGNFNSTRVAKPQVVDTVPTIPPEGIFIVLWEVETSIVRDWVTIPYS